MNYLVFNLTGSNRKAKKKIICISFSPKSGIGWPRAGLSGAKNPGFFSLLFLSSWFDSLDSL